MFQRFVFLILAFFSLTTSAHALVVQGKIFDLENDPSKQIFSFERKETIENGKKKVNARYMDSNGNLALEENFVYPSDKPSGEFLQFESYEYNRVQSGEKAQIKIENGKLLFTHDQSGKTKTNNETFETNTISRDQFVPYIRKNWEALSKGETVKARFILPDRAETIGLNIKKDKEMDVNGKSVIRFIMTPSSFIIAMVAKDTLVTFANDGSKNLLSVEGRTPVLKKDGEKLKNIFGKISFEYLN